jgi:hypothetical protein
MNYKIIFLLFTVLITSCVSEQTGHEGIVIQNPAKVGSIAYNDSLYFEQCKAIKLELSEKSLIGEISQLEISKELIYVLDKKTASLMVFDHTGKYLQSIGKRGSGPGEYSAINAFYLNNHNHTINVFDPLKLSVHRYDFNGNFIESVRFKDLVLAHIVRATPIDNGNLFCFTNPNWCSDSGYFILSEEDYSIREQIYRYPIAIVSEMSFDILDHPYTYYNEEIHYVSLFSNSIQSYANEENLPLYYINNGKKDDSNYLKSIAKSTEENYLKIIITLINDNQYTAGLKNIFETDRYICIDFYEKNLLTKAILWDKKENTGYYIDEYMGYTPHLGAIIYGFDNTLVKVWKNADIQLFKTNLKSGEITDKYPRDFLEIVDQYEEEDNPILLLYTMHDK